jgi:hypothetical protein
MDADHASFDIIVHVNLIPGFWSEKAMGGVDTFRRPNGTLLGTEKNAQNRRLAYQIAGLVAGVRYHPTSQVFSRWISEAARRTVKRRCFLPPASESSSQINLPCPRNSLSRTSADLTRRHPSRKAYSHWQ